MTQLFGEEMMSVKKTWSKMVMAGLLAVMLIAAGCASTSGSEASGGLMGLNSEPSTAVWADWTPADPAARGILPDAFVAEVVAFDYWQIDDPRFAEQAWAGAASVLDYLRREASDGDGLSEKQRRTATLLLQALDGGKVTDSKGLGPRRMDVTYVVSLNPEKAVEGLIVRFFAPIADKGVTPGLAIYLGRDEGTPDGFDRAVMWAKPGFEEAEPFTISLTRSDAPTANGASEGKWSAHQFDGIAAPAADSATDSLQGVADLAGAIFARNFWTPLVGSNYVEARPRAQAESPLPADIEPALGLEVRERQLEEIYRDTVFVPRVQAPAQFL